MAAGLDVTGKVPELGHGLNDREFSITRKGYDREEVKAYLAEIEASLRELEEWALHMKARLAIAEEKNSAIPDIDEAMIAIFEAKERVLERAQRHADRIEADAQERARADAEVVAAEIIAEAQDEARRIAEATLAPAAPATEDSVLEAARTEADRLIEKAPAEADQPVEEARAEAGTVQITEPEGGSADLDPAAPDPSIGLVSVAQIRDFLERYPEETLALLQCWASDPNVHVRRLVSEGTRPRLPWARRLRRFQEDPSPVLELLDLLKDDEEEYVRRSVANNLNDIAKDHPDLVVETAARWWINGSDARRHLISQALRTLVKAGDPRALRILGYNPDSPTHIDSIAVEPADVVIGESVRITVDLANPSSERSDVLVDLVVHFVNANGSTSRKVFKGGERSLPPGGTATVSKTVSVARTRTHYPGLHLVEVQLNGTIHPGGEFNVRLP